MEGKALNSGRIPVPRFDSQPNSKPCPTGADASEAGGIPETIHAYEEAFMKAIITVGLGFGDEGKGATVDFLTRHYEANWVVRYSGGAQAGHNVELSDGRRHTFSQFGAGTFAGAKTYLGPRVIVCPATLAPEAKHLERIGVDRPLGLMTLHPNCLLSTTWMMAMNRMREIDRGADRHGSCGLGIGETRSYWLKHGLDAVTAGDIGDRPVLISKLRLQRDRMLKRVTYW